MLRNDNYSAGGCRRAEIRPEPIRSDSLGAELAEVAARTLETHAGHL